MKTDELKEWVRKYLNVELHPHQEKFIEMLLRKKDPEQLKHEAIDKMVIDRVSRALIGYRIRKPSVLNAILREIYIVTDPEFVGGMKADLIVLDDINDEAVGSNIIKNIDFDKIDNSARIGESNTKIIDNMDFLKINNSVLSNEKALREALEGEEIDLAELGEQHAAEREGCDDR